MIIKYKIKFFDYWHVGSGQSGGSALDNYVLKNDLGLPYIPGKTLKGLVREMADKFAKDQVKNCFGDQGSDENNIAIGQCFFSNACLDELTSQEIVANNLQSELYDVITSTKIDENNIAQDGSLRDIEVSVPIVLYGNIENVSDEFMDMLEKSLRMIKRLGLNRNRGLGRCEFEICKESE